MPRCRPRLLTALAAAALAAAVVVPGLWGVHLHVSGIVQAVVGSALLVACSALALNGSRTVPLPARRAVPAVLATTAANAVTPAGIGGTLLVLRIHRKSGLTAEEAAAAAGLRTAFGALVACATTAVVASTVGLERMPSSRTGLYVGLAVVAAVTAVAVALPSRRRRVLASISRTAVAVGQVLRRPRCLASLLVGCAGVTLAQLLTLQGAVHAVGGHIDTPSLLVALMGSAAARSAVPSPGGVGPIEAALVAGLHALGLGLAAATVAVAVYRVAGHGLPVVGGVVALRDLHRRQLV